MGNALRKEQSSASGPGSSSMFGCLNICPSRNGAKKDHNWNKHMLVKISTWESQNSLKLQQLKQQFYTHSYETRPPIRQQPPPVPVGSEETEWKTVTLTRPTENGLAPVPPPRKKRTSMLSLKSAGLVKNGFKDVFGSDSPRRYSIDSIHNSKRYRERAVDVDVPVRNSVSCHDVCDDSSFADFSREISPNSSSSGRQVLPKVGNKKSDKILGETLSDLSLEHQQPLVAKIEHDPIDKFVEENVAEKKIVAADHKEATHTSASMDESAAMKEKAALLMSMLDKYGKEPDYSDREPVVEEIIVPRKKKTGHVCDDDDFHQHFHNHEKHHNEKLKEDLTEKDLEAMIVTPKKPQRLSDYRKSIENLEISVAKPTETSTPVVAPIRRKKSLNRDDLPSPPKRPGIVEEKGQANLESPKPAKDLELQAPVLQLNLSSEKIQTSQTTTTPPPSPVIPTRLAHQLSTTGSSSSLEPTSPGAASDSSERKSHGKHSKNGAPFNQDALSKMKQRVMEFQMNQEYVMEDISNENDGSAHVNPTKTLDPVTKKISVVSMSSPIILEAPTSEPPLEDPIKVTASKTVTSTSKDSIQDNKSEQESLSASDTLSNDGSGGSSKTIVQCVVQKKIEEKKDIGSAPAEESLFSQSSILLAEKSVENILTSDVNMNILSNVLNDMYDKTVLEEFQNYLETEGTELDDQAKLPGDHSDGLIRDLKLRRAERTSTSSSVSMPSSPVIEAVEMPEPMELPKADKPKKKKKKAKKQPAEDQVSMESISDDGFTNLVKVASKEDITNNALLAVAQTRPRRESICDVDNWFNNHIDPEPGSSLNVDNLRDVRLMRRGSDFGVGYDKGSIFPFGRSRHDSESSEFFEKNKFSKSSDNLGGSNSSLNRDINSSINFGSNGSLNKDHSSLLRFVVQSSALAAETPKKTMEEIKNEINKPVKLSPPSIEIVVTPEEGDKISVDVIKD